MTRTPQEIFDFLKQVRYPGLSRDIVSFNIVKNIEVDRKSTRLNSSHIQKSRMPSSA